MTLDNFPTTRPAFTANFARSQQMPPQVTFSRASTGTYVGENGLIQTAQNDAPRFNWQDGKCQGLLIEEARTNLQFNSEAFATDTAWRINNDYTRGANTTELAPDGTNTACEFFEQTNGGNKSGVESATSLGQVTLNSGRLTVSVYNKPINCDTFMIMPSDSVSNVANCTSIVNDTWDFNASFVVSARSEPVGNGWYRMSATFILPAGVNIPRPLFSSQMYVGPTDTPDPSQGCTLWGAQAEVGAFVTSYIPNTGTTGSVTRAADLCAITGDDFSSWFNNSQSTMVATASTSTPPGNNALIYGFGPIQSGRVEHNASAGFQFFVWGAGDTLYAATFQNYQQNVVYKSAFAWQDKNSAASLAGATAKTLEPATTDIGLSNSVGIGSRPNGESRINGCISYISYYPTRVSNDALEALSQ